MQWRKKKETERKSVRAVNRCSKTSRKSMAKRRKNKPKENWKRRKIEIEGKRGKEEKVENEED